MTVLEYFSQSAILSYIGAILLLLLFLIYPFITKLKIYLDAVCHNVPFIVSFAMGPLFLLLSQYFSCFSVCVYSLVVFETLSYLKTIENYEIKHCFYLLIF